MSLMTSHVILLRPWSRALWPRVEKYDSDDRGREEKGGVIDPMVICDRIWIFFRVVE